MSTPMELPPLVELIDLDSDLGVANAARVSMNVWHTEFDDVKDKSLIGFLLKERLQGRPHLRPFTHQYTSVRMTGPLYVKAQIDKHTVGVSINTVSARYKEMETYFTPEKWRKSAPSVKQGSSDEVLEGWAHDIVTTRYQEQCKGAFEAYKFMVESMEVCKEQARGVLPYASMTDWVMTASLWAWFHFWNLRKDKHAQVEIQVYADEIDAIMSAKYPVAWEALKTLHRESPIKQSLEKLICQIESDPYVAITKDYILRQLREIHAKE